MDLARFVDLLDRHGGDVATWPDADRIAAATLLASSVAARDLLEAELDLRRRLGPTQGVTAPPGLLDRIFARAFGPEGAAAPRPETAEPETPAAASDPARRSDDGRPSD